MTQDKMTLDTKFATGIALSVIATVLFLYVLWGLWYADSMRVRRKDGYCPTEKTKTWAHWVQRREGIRIPGHTVILVDTSDEIPARDQETALALIETWVRRAPFLQKVSVYGLPESENKTPVQIGKSWCVPKQGSNADPMYENPRHAEAEFRGVFLARLRRFLGQLMNREEAPQSPIVEALAFLTKKYDDIDSFLLISDMLQHSSLASHYDDSGDMRKECKDIRLDSIQVAYISRGIKQQSMDWRTRWKDCFAQVKSIQ